MLVRNHLIKTFLGKGEFIGTFDGCFNKRLKLYTITKTWNQPKCPSMIDWIGKMWHIYTMEYYAAIRNDEFVSFVGTWMNLENIILSKQEQKMKHCIFSLIGG